MKEKSSTASDHLAIREANGMHQSISIGSSSFESNKPIPEPYTEYGSGRSPELHWDDLPNRARSLVLLDELGAGVVRSSSAKPSPGSMPGRSESGR